MTDTGRSPGAFVGRASELEELGTLLSAAEAGNGFLLLIRGDAGIGKTRLAEELGREAGRRGHAVHWGRCLELAGAPPFWPWVQALRSIAAARDCLAGASAAELAAVTRLVPELGNAAAPRRAGENAALEGEAERFRLFDGIDGFLRRMATGAPLGIVLDDLHAADPPTLLLLEFVARQARDRPLWLVGTYREVDAHADAERSRLISRVTRLGRSLSLGGLSEAEANRLIAQTVGRIPAPLASQIYALTEGNPFFLDEVARLLWPGNDDAGVPSRAPRVAVPTGVREVVRQRLDPLGADCLAVLGTAAVIGREVSFALLREATATEPAWLLDRLGEAAAARLLVPQPGRSHAFAHALIREALYEQIAPSTRAALHRSVGEAIERLHPASLDEHLAELAFHFGHAAPLADADKALDYAARAARRATTLLAHEDAARFYQIALDCLPLLPDEASRPRLVELLLSLGEAQGRAGDTARARAAFERAAQGARARGDGHGLARAALGCGGLGLGVPVGTVDQGLVALFEEALALAPHAYPAALRARLLARLALEIYFSDAAIRRQTLMDEACSLAAETDAATRAYVGQARLVGLWDITPSEVRMEWCGEQVDLGRELGDDEVELRGHTYRLHEVIDSGLADEWEPELQALMRLTERLREPRFLGMAVGTRAMRSVWLGRFGEAEVLAQRAMELGQSVDDLQIPISVGVQSFFMRRLQGPSDAVELSARAILASAPTIPGARCMRILALCDLCRFDEARAEMELLDDAGFTALKRANRLASLVPWLAEAAVLLGDEARMRVLHGELLPLAGRNISLQLRVCFGPAELFLGMVEGGLGRSDEALAHLDAAAALATRMSGMPLFALIQVERARVLAGMGAFAPAAEALREGRGIAAELALGALVARIDHLESAWTAEARRLEQAADSAGELAHAAGQRGRVVPFPRRRVDHAAPAATGQSPAARRPEHGRPPSATLRREGRLWTIAAGGTVFRCAHSKGLLYLAHLVGHPGKSFHALELVAIERPEAGEQAAGAEVDAAGFRIGPPQLGEPLADGKALAAYRRRLEELSEELAEASGLNDLARAARLRDEVDVLTQTLAGCIGIGGRARTTGSFAERARLNVTRAIRSAIQRVAEGHADLGRHLAASIRTGTFCGYAPDAGDTVRWDL